MISRELMSVGNVFAPSRYRQLLTNAKNVSVSIINLGDSTAFRLIEQILNSPSPDCIRQKLWNSVGVLEDLNRGALAILRHSKHVKVIHIIEYHEIMEHSEKAITSQPRVHLIDNW